MSHLVIARKYRPHTFSTVTGQEHVTRTLANSIKRNRIAHAYLFCGPRGVGKTSIARIFAKGLNCKQGPTPEPCSECTNCREIGQGISFAVREIDGASNNSVDNVRDLIETFRSLPAPGSLYKIYIIDEVHMLSTAAFNALLKSLEEPPAHTVFILATTEPHKIPETVISRCQRHDLRALRIEEIERRLVDVLHQEKIVAEREAIQMLARLSDGSMRDAQSLLERVIAFADGPLTAADTGTVLGVVERRALFDLSASIFQRDGARALEVLTAAFARGIDPTLFLREFVTHWRDILVTKIGGQKAASALGIAENQFVEFSRQAQSVENVDLQDLVELARRGADGALRSSYPRYAIEALVVRMASREPAYAIGALIAELGRTSRLGLPSTSSESGVVPAPKIERPVKVVNAATPAPAAPGMARTEASQPVSPTATTSVSGATVDWQGFITFSAQHNVSRVLLEHLRRVSPTLFVAGTLEAQGPEFSVKSLEVKENKEKLQDALTSYHNSKPWQVRLKALAKGSEVLEGSTLHLERRERAEEVEAKRKEMSDHPAIKSLQKAFPGSKIETIRTNTKE